MRKNLLAIGMLAAGISASAQILTHVDDGAKLYVGQGALVYSGGSAEATGTGTYEVHGNVMIDNGGLSTSKTDGSNFTLNLDDTTNFRKYGQLWINNTSQSQITGTVNKAYSDTYHGNYQQIALPFAGKVYSTLNTELPGVAFTNVRFINGKASGENILAYNNALVREDLMTIESTTQDPTQYYILGTKNLSTNYFPGNISGIKGIPAANGISKTLSDAGKGINFGVKGYGKNAYGQFYNSYLYDAWDVSTNNWSGDYGRNIYQFGNPYLTNLDLTLLPAATKNAIKGIRFETSNTATNLSNASHAAKFINFTASGAAVGDYAAIIKPMQEFVIKLRDNSGNPTINFDALRTFSSDPNNLTYNTTTATTRNFTANQSFSTGKSLGTSVKQLDVIALDADKKEIGRTYFVVYADGHSGSYDGYSVQAANSNNIIGTFEEKSAGGLDTSLEESYWLYINEVNEEDFKGKRVPLGLFSDKIAYIQFAVKENMKELSTGASSLSSGESFYVSTSANNVATISQDQIITVPASVINKSDGIGLYYGKPGDSQTLATTGISQKPSATFVVWDDVQGVYKIMFDPTWKKADIKVYDMAGREVSLENKVSTSDNPHTLKVPNQTQGTYIVSAVSESGVVFTQKIIKH